MQVGREIAAGIRGSNPDGLLGVQSMAFPHKNGLIEIACNVDLFQLNPDDSKHQYHLDQGDLELAFDQGYYITKLSRISQAIGEMATQKLSRKDAVLCNTTVIGFTPWEAGKWTQRGLESDIPWLVDKSRNLM